MARLRDFYAVKGRILDEPFANFSTQMTCQGNVSDTRKWVSERATTFAGDKHKYKIHSDSSFKMSVNAPVGLIARIEQEFAANIGNILLSLQAALNEPDSPLVEDPIVQFEDLSATGLMSYDRNVVNPKANEFLLASCCAAPADFIDSFPHKLVNKVVHTPEVLALLYTESFVACVGLQDMGKGIMVVTCAVGLATHLHVRLLFNPPRTSVLDDFLHLI